MPSNESGFAPTIISFIFISYINIHIEVQVFLRVITGLWAPRAVSAVQVTVFLGILPAAVV